MSDVKLAWHTVLAGNWQSRWDASADKGMVLAQLFQYHVECGLIDSNTVSQVSRPEWLSQSGFLVKLTINPGRRDRGLSLNPHPSPIHRIPFKDGMPCFCCSDVVAYQWPDERGIWLGGNRPMVILPNIFPLFASHFTVVSAIHRPQCIDLTVIHRIASLVPTAWVVQNDADAGASNPWHFHLQLFFDDTLPLCRYRTERSLSNAVELLAHPALILKINNPEIADNLARAYLNLGITRRLNVLVRDKTAYLVLRDTRYRTSLYITGQPGFPEPAGMLALPSETVAEGWRTSPDRYRQLMTDIRPTDDQTNAFLVGINSV